MTTWLSWYQKLIEHKDIIPTIIAIPFSTSDQTSLLTVDCS